MEKQVETSNWLWTERTLLVMSILGNVIAVALWVHSQRVERALKYAEFNDRSWMTVRDFQHRLEGIQTSSRAELDQLLDSKDGNATIELPDRVARMQEK